MEKTVENALFMLLGLNYPQLEYTEHNKIITAIHQYLLQRTEHHSIDKDIIKLTKKYSTVNFCITVAHPKITNEILIFVDTTNCLLTLIENRRLPVVEELHKINYFLDFIALTRIDNFLSSIPI